MARAEVLEEEGGGMFLFQTDDVVEQLVGQQQFGTDTLERSSFTTTLH